MSEFELQRDLRGLLGERMPTRDLWPAIATRIEGAALEAPAPLRRHRRWFPFGVAAAMTLAVGAGLASRALEQRSRETVGGESPTMRSVQAQIERARELARSGDPQLAGAEVVIDTASSELEQALAQQPDAVFLVGLINRTEAQRRKLARLGMHAG
ncbi:MAG: hypothetical protein J0L88_13890 [Xanthomonadales bacterium]|nr:hypothetical protein [Xanthomonadales bacterium]